VKYSDLFVYVLSEVPGCPDFTAERAIRDTCIDFCARTGLYKAEPLSVIVVPGITDYELDAPVGTEPNHVNKVLRQGRELAKLPYEDAFMRNELAGVNRSVPQYFSQYDNSNLLIGPAPKEKETLKVLYTLKPTTTSTSIPDTIGREHREVLVSGALFRLQMMAGSPWANGGAAQANSMIYEQGVTAAIRQAKYGHSGASLTVTYREFM
jgi:hypothetical protein